MQKEHLFSEWREKNGFSLRKKRALFEPQDILV
jgi:hypothetical protein